MRTLIFLSVSLLAATLNAATVRYELLNEPAKQGGKDVAGFVIVETSGSAVPARGFVPLGNIVDWQVECDGQVIAAATANRETRGVSIWNQGYGNNLVATPDGLYMQGYGESGSYIEFENIVGGTPPYTESVTYRIKTRSVGQKKEVSGRTVVVWEDMIERKFFSGQSPNWTYGINTLTRPTVEPLKYANYIKIADRPSLVPRVVPTPPTPVNPPVVAPPAPVEPTGNLSQLKARRSQLILELYQVQNQIDSLQ